MKIASLTSLILLVLLSFECQAQVLPAGSRVIETAPLSSNLHKNRALVLWMLNPAENPNGYELDDPYTCPDETRGSCYSGPTRVSLFDTRTNKVLNTIKIADVHLAGKDTFDLPYKIRKGYYYYVKEAGQGIEERPVIMLLKDYNGDGKALEFALFDAPFCMGLQTTLIGYSEVQDKVIQYSVALRVVYTKQQALEVSPWVGYLFTENPISPRHWKYEVDYRGRGGWLENYEIYYNARRERFEGTLTRRE